MSKANVGRRNLENYRWWTAEDDAQLTDLYATHKLKDIAEIMGRSVSSVSNRRVKLEIDMARATDGDFKGSGFIDVDPGRGIQQRKLEGRRGA